MQVIILTIGDEILSGDILDTNKQFLSEECWQRGFGVEEHLSIRDDEHAIRAAILALRGRADVVLCTGGLGPTQDDFTIEIASKAFGVDTVEDAATVKLLMRWFEGRGRALTPENRKQALIPKGGRALHNRFGTAPGVAYDFDGTQFYFMPGVPREMKAIFTASVLPEMQERQAHGGEKVFFEARLLRTFGLPESEMAGKLKDLFGSRLQIEGVRVGFRVAFPDVYVKLSAWGDSSDSARARLNRVAAQVRTRIGQFIYAEAPKSLEQVVGERLIAAGKTVAVAESCTGGLLAHRLTNVSGISAVFRAGYVTYSNDAKTRLLGVDAALIAKHGAVSAACARAMVAGLHQVTGADFCAAITGIAGPTGGSETKPVGTVFIATRCDQDIEVKDYVLPFPREMFKQVATSLALRRFWLRLVA